jgi:hypothetical protein
MPNQSLLYTGRVLACSQLNTMMHVCRELCGGQIEETDLGAARMTYAGHLFEATGTTPALAWVINAIVDALAEFGVRHA